MYANNMVFYGNAVLFPDDHDVYFEKCLYTGIGEINYTPKENALDPATVFPNPCSEIIRFALKTQGNDPFKASIFDIQGRKIEGALYSICDAVNTYLMNVSHLPRGVYFLRIKHAAGNHYSRFTVIR